MLPYISARRAAVYYTTSTGYLLVLLSSRFLAAGLWQRLLLLSCSIKMQCMRCRIPSSHILFGVAIP
jgi:hypothetical protein